MTEIEQAVARERERCAALAEKMADQHTKMAEGLATIGSWIMVEAQRIRAEEARDIAREIRRLPPEDMP